jgi:glycosyltransferase involved in cell wall biosynthesis
MVNELSLQNHVFFHGAQYGKDLERLFVEANVFLLSGTGGLAINEAMAYSLPVITTPGDGTAYDLIEEEENGFLLDFNYTIEELESKMSYFATISEAKFKSMGENSRKIVENTASMGNMVSQIMKSLNFD